MNKLIKYISDFFKAKEKSYLVKKSSYEVTTCIMEIPTTTGFWGSNDFELSDFQGNTFSLRLASTAASRSRLSSHLNGEIISSKENEMIIRIKIYGSTLLYIWFSILVVLGLVYFGKAFFLQDTAYIFSGVFIGICLPLLAPWYRNVCDTTIIERFENLLKDNLGPIEHREQG